MTSKSAVSISLSLLEKRDKIKVYLMIMFQVALSILDLVGIALFAVLGSLAINGTSSNSNGERVTSVLNFLSLNNLPIQQQAAFIGLLASSLLVIKTLSSLFFTRKIIFFLSVRSAHVTKNLTAQLLSQPLQTIQKRSMQQNIYALTGGVSNMMNQIIASSMAIVSDLALVSIMLVGLFYLDPLMSILTLVIFGGVALGLFYLLHHKARSLGLKKGELDIQSIELIQEILLAYREAVAGSKRGYYVKKLSEQQISLATNVAKVNFLPNISKYVLEITVIAGTVLISAFQFVRQDAAQSVAILTAFLAASSRIAPAILRIQQNAIQVKSNAGMAKPSIDLINEIKHLNIPPEEKSLFSKNHGEVNWVIELQDISFKYEGSSNLILNKIDLTIPFGTLVSIVGKSGVGKTTLADMILGVNEPTFGKILISGKKPGAMCHDFPGGLAYVSQDILMINGTIRQNICMGYNLEEVSDEDINASLEKANLLEFVNSLEKGLDTYIGDRGTKLSGGQKQRIGIARALLSTPRILVMDEATSALDNESESAISESLHKIRGTTTIILIAHRIKTVMNSDLVVYLENGAIKSKGTFEEVRGKVPKFDLAAIEVGL